MEFPSSVRNLLWEYAVDDFQVDETALDTVLERVMQHGGWAEINWLLQTVDSDRLRSFLEDRGRRTLTPRDLRFWAHVCGVPADEQNGWVDEAMQREQMWR
jgi:hypothetical protein